MASTSSKLPTAPCGRHGLVLPRIGLGTMGMTAFYGANPVACEEESLRTISRALELGSNHFDTAWVYQTNFEGKQYYNEELVGKVLKQHGRENFIIATKFGIDFSRVAQGLSPYVADEASIRKMLAESLERLGTDYIDLYYQHRQDTATPIEDVARVLEALRQEGKIRYIGFSEVTADELRRAAKICPVSALQMEYSLQSRDIEASVLPAARELGVGIVAYSPLGRGLLTRSFESADELSASDWRRSQPRMLGDNLAVNLSAADRLAAEADKRGVSAAELALAWVLAQGQDIFPIPGCKAVARLEQNVGAAKVQLTTDEAAALATLIGEAAGTRYDENLMKTTFGSREAATAESV